VLGEHATSLAAAARAYLNVDLDKSQQVSDWNAPSLTQAQIDYAAIDAVVAWRIGERILPRFEGSDRPKDSAGRRSRGHADGAAVSSLTSRRTRG
jgi:ribonuclease D